MGSRAGFLIAAAFAATLGAQPFECLEEGLPAELSEIYAPRPLPAIGIPGSRRDHRLDGRASYYSSKLEGRKTASGEKFTNSGFTAAHRTLPLGTWIEVTSLATGRTIRLRVNDRGPFTGGFVLDLSRTAAHAIGVDRIDDRRVKIKVIAWPGQRPPPS